MLQGPGGESSYRQQSSTGGSSSKIPSLRESAYEELLNAIVEGKVADANVFATAGQLNDFLPKLKTKFYARAHELHLNENSLNALCKSLSKATTIDLSHFKHLKRPDILEGIEKLLKHHSEVIALNLSVFGLPGAQMLDILSSQPNLQSLYLMDNEGVTLKDFTNADPLCDIYQPETLRQPLLDWPCGIGSNSGIASGPNKISHITFVITTESWISIRIESRSLFEDLYFVEEEPSYARMNTATSFCILKSLSSMPHSVHRLVRGFGRLLQWYASAFHSRSIRALSLVSFTGPAPFNCIALLVKPPSIESLDWSNSLQLYRLTGQPPFNCIV